MEARIREHARIRDDILQVIAEADGVRARKTNGGSYLFVELPELEIPITDFVKVARELTGVVVTPGTEFGPQFTHHFRINFSQDHDAAVDAMRRLLKVAERYRKVDK